MGRTLISPCLAVLLVAGLTWLVLSNFTLLIGGSMATAVPTVVDGLLTRHSRLAAARTAPRTLCPAITTS